MNHPIPRGASPACARSITPARIAVVACIAIASGGCATITEDHGFDRVAAVTHDRLGIDVSAPEPRNDDAVHRRVDALLAEPLTADAAVEVALLSNRALRATVRELGIAEADWVQAGRLPNPGLEFKHTRGGGALTIERTFVAAVGTLLTMPIATRIARGRMDQVRLEVSDAVLRTAAATRRAWIEAVAADQRAAYAAQVVEAADAATLLAQQMRETGNWSALADLRERAVAATATSDAIRARQDVVRRREQLTRLLGLTGASSYRLPARLPDLPPRLTPIAEAERDAMAQRLDLEADRVANERLATSLGLTKATRFVDALEIGRNVDDHRPDEPHESGYEIRIEVPLFDFGGARVAKAEALTSQALERSAQHAIDAMSEVRERHAGYQNAWELARHDQTVVLPMQRRIAAENQLRYNGMLVGVFELIASARDETAAVVATLDALRDFWIAEADLAESLGGRLPPTVIAKEQP